MSSTETLKPTEVSPVLEDRTKAKINPGEITWDDYRAAVEVQQTEEEKPADETDNLFEVLPTTATHRNPTTDQLMTPTQDLIQRKFGIHHARSSH